MSAPGVRPFVAKEFHVLVPAWIGAALAIAAAVVSGPGNHELGLIAYAFGSVVLGAQAVGHEYTHRTLAQLLSQPWSRGRILVVKLAVLTTMVSALAAFAWVVLLQPGDGYWVFASVLNAVCIAPLLAMAARNPLAGVVFTGAAPIWLLVIGRYVSARALWAGTFAICAAAAIAGCRLFMRLEAIDGRGQELRMPELFRRWSSATFAVATERRRTKRSVWLLVKKELRLQQMTFAVTGVWLAFWIVESVLPRIVPGFVGLPLPVVSVLFGTLLALLIGSLASAEERQLGTLEWQALLPMAAWLQWVVKLGTTFSLAAVLSFGLPILLADGHLSVSAWYVGVILLFTTGGLYASSLCQTTLRALIVAGPAMLALTMLVVRVVSAYRFPTPLLAAPPVLVVVPMLWFAFENHRRVEQGAGRVSRQMIWIAGCLALGVALVAVIA